MKLGLKKQILKITSLVFMTLILFASFSNTTLALGELVKDGVYDGCTIASVWNCAETSTSIPMQKNCPNVNSGLYIEAKVKTPVDCIRDGGCATYGKKCAVECIDPTACGSCDCRCYADGGLKCEDKWIQSGIVMAQSCTIPTGILVNSLPSNGKNVKCVPTAKIISPINNSIFTKGTAIAFKASVTDPIGEAITAYNWVIRTKANNTAGIFTADIYGYTQDFTISTLPAESYYAFFSAKNANNIWSDWVRVGFSVVNAPACTGTIPLGSSAWDLEEGQFLLVDTPWSFAGTDTATKCQYHTYSCTGTIPAGNITWDAEESQSLSVDTPWSFAATDDTATKCQYHVTPSFSCTGTEPASPSEKCPYTETDLIVDTLWTEAGTSETDCSAGNKCEYYTPCNVGCIDTPTACTETCGNEDHTCTMQNSDCSLISDYPLNCGLPPCPATENLQWREVSPN